MAYKYPSCDAFHWFCKTARFFATEPDVFVSHGLRERIEDLRKQIDLMSDQLGKKDDQLTQLNEVTQKQAVHIQSLI
jgi:hypothetical protein